MIDGVIGVTFLTGDLEHIFVFDNDVLGLPLHSRHGDFNAFGLGDVRFSIGLHNEVSGASKDPFRFMPHLGADDIHAEAQRLAQAGVEFIRQPEQASRGGWVATGKEPDGQSLHMWQSG